jgi:type I restriction enzyme, S subunit
MTQGELLATWKHKKFSEVTESFDGLRVPLNKSQRDKIDGPYPYFGASGQIDTINDYKFDGRYLLIAEDGENLRSRKKPIAFIVDGKFWVNNHAHVVSTREEISMNYLCYYVNALNIMDYARDQVTRPKLRKSDLDNISIRFPDLNTQSKIVEKLDYILGKFEDKKKAIQDLHDDIAHNFYFLNNKFLRKKLIELMRLDDPPWKVVNFEELCESIQPGFAEGKKNVEGGTIHLRMNNIGTNFELNLDLLRKISASPQNLEKYKLQGGDIIFNNTNSSKLIGKSAIFTRGETCLYSNHLTRIRPNAKLAVSEWILFYLRTRWLKRDFEHMCNKWINQAAIKTKKIKKLQIPLPSLDTQKEIVNDLRRVSSIMTAIKEKEKLIITSHKQTQNQMEKLYYKILRSAFFL